MESRQDIWNIVIERASGETNKMLRIDFSGVVFDEGINIISTSGLAIAIVENKVEMFVWFIESFLSAINTSESLSFSSKVETLSDNFDLNFRELFVKEFGLSTSEITECKVIEKFYEFLSIHLKS